MGNKQQKRGACACTTVESGKWLVTFLLALISIGCYGQAKVDFPVCFEKFVNELEGEVLSCDVDDWKESSEKFYSLLQVYGEVYNELTLEDLDKVDEAIDRYQALFRECVSAGNNGRDFPPRALG